MRLYNMENVLMGKNWQCQNSKLKNSEIKITELESKIVKKLFENRVSEYCQA